MSRRLDVYLYDCKAGQLIQKEDGRLSFLYEAGFSKDMILSIDMPVRREAYGHKECHAFFGGLLPEEDERRKLAEALQISERNDFKILEIIGRECAGAVSIFPEGESPEFSGENHLIGDATPAQKISRERLGDILEKLRTRSAFVFDDLRFSLAGAQKKIALTMIDDEFFFPDKTHLSTHIFKPPHDRFQYTVENEFFCMKLAKNVGLSVGNVKLVQIKQGYNVLCVERYDRARLHEVGEGRNLSKITLIRMHQEDFCQALGIWPENKYQNEDGPGLGDAFDVLQRVSKIPSQDRQKLLDTVMFNYLIGNNDAHGKNFSLLLGHKMMGNIIKLAPAYDLICTEIYVDDPEYKSKMAMSIGGKYNPYEVHERHWEKFSHECGLTPSYVFKRLLEMAKRIAAAFQPLCEDLKKEGADSSIYNDIYTVFRRRADHISGY